jgi:hypothetical protein
MVQHELVAWINGLSASATNRATNSATNATNGKTAGMWVEVVRVKDHLYVRVMRWRPGKGKEFVKYLGSLENVKSRGGYYAVEAERLERKRLAGFSRKAGVNSQPRIGVPNERSNGD